MKALGHLFRSKIVLAVLIGLTACYFRAIAIQTTVIEAPLRADALEYYFSAYNLVHQGTYSRSAAALSDPQAIVRPDAYRPPGLPLIIAGFLSITPSPSAALTAMQAANLVAGIFAAIALFIAAAAMLPLPVAFAAGLMVAASPHLVAISVYLLTEPFAICLVALLLALTTLDVPIAGRRRFAYFFGLGATIGCLALLGPSSSRSPRSCALRSIITRIDATRWCSAASAQLCALRPGSSETS